MMMGERAEGSIQPLIIAVRRGTAHHLHPPAMPSPPRPIYKLLSHHQPPGAPDHITAPPLLLLLRFPLRRREGSPRPVSLVSSSHPARDVRQALRKMMPLDLGLSLGGLTSQGSLSSSSTTTASGALSPWAAALNAVVGDFATTTRPDAQAQHHQQRDAPPADPDRGAMRASTSPDSAAALSSGDNGSKRERGDELERTGSGGVRSDEEDAAGGRKKLRLSKDQAAVLEECFKTHSTLNPKQKLALANRLGLRPRQVEVWFQNRRARTKLKQTEVDCEYLKRWCERLADENKRLEKELADLRALKAAPSPAAPAATLTMCPSCRRVASSAAAATPAATNHHHQCHPTKSILPAAAANVVPSHCQFFPAAVDRTSQSTWNAAAPLVTRELF
ncbi:hypothetical protein BS78_10G030500 [Paspalum vaginatum]|nr:hypothetical protein BS78_10G030500 [Paspalum vaginatum]